MSTLCIITARGGSKRIPRKNIKLFMDRPMISYAIAAARESEVFDEVMVSTDDEEIASVARKCGAIIPFMRSAKTSDDHATTFDVLEEVLSEYGKLGRVWDAICCIYPCVPFLTAQTLRTAYGKFSGHDALMPVCQYSTPIEWAMRIEQGLLVPNDRGAQLMRSQDLKPKYYDAGMFYFCSTEKLLRYRSLVPPRTVAFLVNDLECQDIDTMDDWKMAEMKYRLLNETRS